MAPHTAQETAALDARAARLEGLAREAGGLAMDYFGKADRLGVTMKGAQDWLTEADCAVERLIRQRLAAAFPGDAVIGEEMGGEGGAITWIIDPIDGTANFARGDRIWCVSIGMALNGTPALGVVYAPALDELYLGRIGQGATMNGERLKAAPTADLGFAAVEIGWSKRRPLDQYLGWVRRTFEAGASVKRSASGAMGLMHVANGRTDGYAEPHINSWDVLAGLVIAAEAGAVLNDFCAGDWMRDGNPILCAAPGVAGHLSELYGLPLAKG